jgi:hypothetical protein
VKVEGFVITRSLAPRRAYCNVVTTPPPPPPPPPTTTKTKTTTQTKTTKTKTTTNSGAATLLFQGLGFLTTPFH